MFSFSGGSSLQNVFSREGLTPKVALTARDSDVIKTYVRLGLGVGIVASVAIEPAHDADLAVIDASHLFPIHTTWVGFRRGTLLRNFAYEFMQLFGPHLTRQLIDRAIEARDGDGQSELFPEDFAAHPLNPATRRRSAPRHETHKIIVAVRDDAPPSRGSRRRTPARRARPGTSRRACRSRRRGRGTCARTLRRRWRAGAGGPRG